MMLMLRYEHIGVLPSLQVWIDYINRNIELKGVGKEDCKGHHQLDYSGQTNKERKFIRFHSILNFFTHISPTGRLRVMLPVTASPYLRYPKKPTAMYRQETMVIDVFKTPFQP